MTLAVHLLVEPAEDGVAALREQLGSEVSLTVGEECIPETCRVLVAGRPDRATVLGLEHLEFLVVPWAGIPDDVVELAALRPGLRVHNLHHNAPATAETAVALLLAAAKRLVPFDRALRGGDWSGRYAPSPSVVLEGKTAVVLGLGEIGRRVTRACRGLGMRVLATRARAREVEEEDGVAVHPSGDLRDLLPEADALVVTVPLTPRTRGLLGRPELALLRRGALLVNVGRGPVIDEEALYDALVSEQVGAAGLDVWYCYPRTPGDRTDCPPSRFDFGGLDNVVLSPHRAGSAADSEARRMAALAGLLLAIARGSPVPNEVDAEAGY